MATLITATSGNISNYVWNYVLDTHVPMTGTPSNSKSATIFRTLTNTSSLTASANLSFATFSGSWSASHIGVRMAFNIGASATTIIGTLSVAIGLVADGTTLTASTIVTGSRVDYNVNYLPYYMSLKEFNDLSTSAASLVKTDSTISSPHKGSGLAGSFGERISTYYTYNTWLLFKMPQIISLNASSVYTILITYNGTLVGNDTNSPPGFLFSYNRNDGTAALNSLIITTRTQSRVLTDNVIIAGEYFNSTQSNVCNINMDATASTATFSSITIGSNGVLNFVTASSYNPYLQLKGPLDIGGNGILNIGLSSSPIPSNSNAKIEFSSTYSYPFDTYATFSFYISDGIFLRMGAVLNSCGTTTSSYRSLIKNYMPVGSSTVSLVNSVSWNIGDSIVISPTERYNQGETFTLTQAVSGFTISLPSATSYIHSATFSAEVCNLTRNIKIGSVNSNYGSYILNYYGNLNLNNSELYNLGFKIDDPFSSDFQSDISLATNRGGIFFNNNISASFSFLNIEGCSIRNSTQGISSNSIDSFYHYYPNEVSNYDVCGFNINNNIIYYIRYAMLFGDFTTNSLSTINNVKKSYYTKNGDFTSNITNNITNNLIIGNYTVNQPFAASFIGSAVVLGQSDILFTGNKLVGLFGDTPNVNYNTRASFSIYLNYLDASWYAPYQNLIDNNTLIANEYGFNLVTFFTNLTGSTISNINIYKTYYSGIASIAGSDIVLNNFNLVSNNVSNNSGEVQFKMGGNFYYPNSGPITFVSSTFSGTTYVVNLYPDNINLKFVNCYFSSTTDFYNTAQVASTTNTYARNYRIFLDNCTSVSSSIFSYNNTNLLQWNRHSYIKTKNLNGVTASFKTFYSFGTVESDTTITRLGGASIKGSPKTSINLYGSGTNTLLTSTNSNIYLEVSKKVIPVFKNKITNISAWVRKSKTSDGQNYNGLQPRIVISANINLGFNYNTVIKSGISNNGIFEQIQGTFSCLNDGVAEVWVECNGSSGWINVDDWSISYT